MNRVGRWTGFLISLIGLVLGLLSLTSTPWLRVSSAAEVFGIQFSLVRQSTQSLRLPTATAVYFGWLAWVLLAALTIGAVLSGLRIERSWLIAAPTVVVSIAAIALVIQACRPLVNDAHGIRTGPGPWFAATGYLLLGASAVVSAIAGRAPRT